MLKEIPVNLAENIIRSEPVLALRIQCPVINLVVVSLGQDSSFSIGSVELGHLYSFQTVITLWTMGMASFLIQQTIMSPVLISSFLCKNRMSPLQYAGSMLPLQLRFAKLPQDNHHWRLGVGDQAHGLPDHQGRANDHSEVESLQEELIMNSGIPCGLSWIGFV